MGRPKLPYRGTTLYKIWHGMRQRCGNPNSPGYARYGGRGIRVCEEWENDFEAFVAYVGERPAGKTLDRIDNNRGYEPGNVRWATRFQQQENRHCARLYTYRGETKNLNSWSRVVGISWAVLDQRIKLGWSVEEAFERPPIPPRQRRGRLSPRQSP
jgi:hypothetical protein